MGAENQPQKKTQPQKTLKDEVKEYTKDIEKMRREYGREKYKLQYQGKNLNRELKRKIQKKQSKQLQKAVAQRIMKNNQMLAKYEKLDNQLQNITFELKQMVVNESMQNVMLGMANIMGSANGKMKNQDANEVMKRFMNEKQRMNVMNEYIGDIMNTQDEEIDDQNVDKLISDMQHEAVAKKQKKIQMDLNEYENALDDI